jgi:hypothetical protein
MGFDATLNVVAIFFKNIVPVFFFHCFVLPMLLEMGGLFTFISNFGAALCSFASPASWMMLILGLMHSAC